MFIVQRKNSVTEPTKLTIVFLIVMSIGLIALAIEWLRMKVNGWMILIIVSLMLLALALSIHPAKSHDHSKPGLDSWYQSLRSGRGPCCDGPGKDATHLSDVDWESKDGRYRVRIHGEWIDVPPDAVLNVPNRDGRTLVWTLHVNGRPIVRCFMVGFMT